MRIFPQRFWQGVFLSLKDLNLCLLFTAGIGSFLSLYSYNPFDNSFNTASYSATTNWLGSYGAYVADFLWQIFGSFSYLIAAIFIMYFLKIILERFNKFWNFSLPLMIFGLFFLMTSSAHYHHLDHQLFSGVLGWTLYKIINKLFSLYFTSEWMDELYFFFSISGMLCILFSLKISEGVIKNITHWCTERFFKTKKFYNYLYNHAQNKWLSNSRLLQKKESSLPTDNDFDDDFPHQNTKVNNITPLDNSAEEIQVSLAQKKDKKTEKPQAREDGYILPPIDLLSDTTSSKKVFVDHNELNEQSKILMDVLEEFGVKGEIVNIRSGPVVTMFELKPAAGIKTARVIGLADDIARSMSALSARIANIPGQNVIGIELPNKKRQTVYMRDLLLSDDFKNTKSSLPLVLGQDIVGKPTIADLAKMPHLLVAGTTGSGKSVAVNAMICSILFRLSPEECRFIMIDPKMLELSVYNDIPHLLTPVVTEPKKAIVALKWAVKEMENRYRNMSRLGVRNIDGYNERLKEARAKGEIITRRIQTGFDPDTGHAIFENQVLDLKPLPFIIVVIDEMADLMLVAGKEVEAAVQRLAQMARAAGLHLIMATQRPSVDVITGTIKANFPTRISFQVTSRIDSRTILGEQGAEQLLGQGDMLYMGGASRVTRVHGPFMKDSEVEAIVNFLKAQGEPSYIDDVTTDTEEMLSGGSGDDSAEGGDAFFHKAVDLVKNTKKVSTSSIQRHFQIGYNRAARIVDMMEKQGIVSEPNHQGKREVLV